VKGARAAVGLVGALPWLRALAGPALGSSTKGAIDGAFLALCHHAVDRTMSIWGVPMCVCSRCAGVYAGMLLAALWPWKIAARAPRIALPLGALVMMADIATQDLGLHAPWHALRLATGAWVAWAATTWMLGELDRGAESGGLARAPRHGGAGAT
jgi:uncharacterized membrane protein